MSQSEVSSVMTNDFANLEISSVGIDLMTEDNIEQTLQLIKEGAYQDDSTFKTSMKRLGAMVKKSNWKLIAKTIKDVLKKNQRLALALYFHSQKLISSPEGSRYLDEELKSLFPFPAQASQA